MDLDWYIWFDRFGLVDFDWYLCFRRNCRFGYLSFVQYIFVLFDLALVQPSAKAKSRLRDMYPEDGVLHFN